MKKKHLRVIQMIQEGIPKELLSKLTKKELQSPTIKKLFELALTKPDSEVSPRLKRNYRAMLDSGRLDREVEVLDHEVEKLIDVYIKTEIDKAVKLGRLPKVAPEMQLKSLKNKGLQYARRTERRLRTEFLGEGDDVEAAPQDDQNHEAQHPARSSHDEAIPVPSAAVFR